MDNQSFWQLLRSNIKLQKRLLAVIIFTSALIYFRFLAPLLIAFIIFTHVLLFISKKAQHLFKKWPNHADRIAILISLIGLGLLILVAWLGGKRWVKWDHIPLYTAELKKLAYAAYGQFMPDFLKKYKLWEQFQDFFNEQFGQISFHDKLQRFWHYTRIVTYVILGLVGSWVYFWQRQIVDTWFDGPGHETILGLFRRYILYVSEAVMITLRLQIMVAAVNTLLTLPILLLLRLPHLAVLSLVIFICSLIPILGNLISGAILIAVAWMNKGFLSAGVFWISTAILHKLETYYLNPRLAAKHVKLPTLILILSMVVFEHIFGVMGLFLSFPCLYVALRIRQDIHTSIANE